MTSRLKGRAGVDHIGVGVAAALLDSEGAIALFHRKRGGESGLWGLPGGHVRIGETFVRAVKREVREELGVKVIRCRSLGFSEDVREEGHWLSALFLIEETEGLPTNRLPTVHHELFWARMDNLPGEITVVTRHMIERLQNSGEPWQTKQQP